MRRSLLVAVAAAAVTPTPTASAATCAGADTVPSAGSVAEVRSATLCLLNAERTQRGRRPLRSNAGLALAGRRHAKDMVRRRYFAHASRSGAGFDDRIKAAGYLRGARAATIGENLGWGSGSLSTPRSMVRSWMASPGHRANMLRPAFREIRIGIAHGAPVPSIGPGGPALTYANEFGTRD